MSQKRRKRYQSFRVITLLTFQNTEQSGLLKSWFSIKAYFIIVFVDCDPSATVLSD